MMASKWANGQTGKRSNSQAINQPNSGTLPCVFGNATLSTGACLLFVSRETRQIDDRTGSVLAATFAQAGS